MAARTPSWSRSRSAASSASRAKPARPRRPSRRLRRSAQAGRAKPAAPRRAASARPVDDMTRAQGAPGEIAARGRRSAHGLARGSAPPRRPRSRSSRPRTRSAAPRKIAAPRKKPPSRRASAEEAAAEQTRRARAGSPKPQRRRARRRRRARLPPPRRSPRAQAPRAGAASRAAAKTTAIRGKLTVTRALSGEDDSRARSLAALRRAREKEKRHHQQAGPAAKQVRDVVVPEAITVQELANRMAERAADLVKALFKMGMPVTVTQTIDQDTAELLVTEFGHTIKRVSEGDIDIGIGDDAGCAREPSAAPAGGDHHGPRRPRQDLAARRDPRRGRRRPAKPAASPSISAPIRSPCPTSRRSPSSTRPGHEAFTEMRARGANVTDIVVLVVAADDGLKPQTIEAINHTSAAGVPMIVAINKIDKPDAKPQKVREELLQHEVIVEEMGGEVQDVEVSATKKTNLDKLLEAIAAPGRNPRIEGQPRARRRRHGDRSQARQGPRPAGDRADPARHAARRRRVRRRRVERQGPRDDRRQGQPGEGSRPVGPGRSPRPVRGSGRRRSVHRGRERSPGARSRRLSPGPARPQAHHHRAGQPREHVRVARLGDQGAAAGRQGRRPRLGRSDRPCAQPPVDRRNQGARAAFGRRRDHRERRHSGERQRRADHRLQRPPQRQGARGRRRATRSSCAITTSSIT